MNIRFWGVRGSIASPLTNTELVLKIETAVQMAVSAGICHADQVKDFIRNLPWPVLMTTGGDTTCIQVQTHDKLLILDAGSGIRRLGLKLVRESNGAPIDAHILLSHTHLDHINGLPFFVPAFNPENNLIFYGAHPNLEGRIQHQQHSEFFPVPFLSAFHFVQLQERDCFRIGDAEIEITPLNHPGNSYGYRIVSRGKTLVYATDSEYKDLSADALKPYTDFFHKADLLIFDAQYTMLENVEKEDWGHSNVFTGIDMALEAGVKRIVFTHHEPTYDDRKLWEILKMAEEYLMLQGAEDELKLYIAFEGGRISL